MASFKTGSLIFALLFASLFLFDSTNCKAIKHKCKHIPGVLVNCITTPDPVCAYFRDGKDCKLAQRASLNACTACADETSLYYIEGECTGNKVYCDTKAQPEFCTLEYNPVCAYTADGSFTAGNKCAACADIDVKYYVVGECAQ